MKFENLFVYLNICYCISANRRLSFKQHVFDYVTSCAPAFVYVSLESKWTLLRNLKQTPDDLCPESLEKMHSRKHINTLIKIGGSFECALLDVHTFSLPLWLALNIEKWGIRTNTTKKKKRKGWMTS